MGYFVRFDAPQGVLWLNLERICGVEYDKGTKLLRVHYDAGTTQEVSGVPLCGMTAFEQQLTKFNLVSNRH